ncbi:tachykinin-like peptides receptor 86C [Oratosquilla oratoria]|uniref:tachykinin-like peptides receptor 86C n=1 Tax=Oratosquilla oratoria TaxID=337810 RepID=UPI003F7668CA
MIGEEEEEEEDLVQTNPFILPVYQQVLWISAFALMISVACIGNILVLWIVIANKRMRTTTNYFLINLSIADLMMATFNCAFNLAFLLNGDWPFGAAYCTFSQFVAHVTLGASVFTLTVISFDRFRNAMRPLRPRMSKCCFLLLIGAIWTISICLSAPILPYSTTVTFDLTGRSICVIQWPDGPLDASRMDFIFNVLIFAITYVIPMVAMVVCYAIIGCKLWDRGSKPNMTVRQVDSIRSKEKVVKMLALLVILFALCWLPYHVYFIVQYIYQDLGRQHYAQHMYLAFYWLAMSNSMINPIVYYYLNAR